ncbi:MAG: hypothetical protein KKD44_21055 [Proteobacteria bacterium]|nr:hypothetical protein [Pseudomonadota bacterium]
MPGGAVAAVMYDDHLEITNPGELHFGITPEKLAEPHESRPWNPISANVFYRAGIIERWGMGSLNIIDWCAENENPQPVWSQQTDSIFVTVQSSALRTESGNENVTGEVLRLLSAMKGEMKRLEIQTELNLKHESHFREAYLVPALHDGLITMTVPNKPRSSKQKYRLTDKGQRILRGKDHV